ncbi:unnamed protein product [Hymenolepis diminuta]|uniref:Uncharacterized protein n=1 Tax=Hymenolepis diminuta TaxID=6216 RepID=A0A564ZBV0_HYMDI|nr:unnamed protein product [Hymenolepis diminuta]
MNSTTTQKQITLLLTGLKGVRILSETISPISQKGHFKSLLFLNGLSELCQTSVESLE